MSISSWMLEKSSLIRALSDSELSVMARLVRREQQRRKKIHSKNAAWTANEGLVACLEASVKGKSNG